MQITLKQIPNSSITITKGQIKKQYEISAMDSELFPVSSFIGKKVTIAQGMLVVAKIKKEAGYMDEVNFLVEKGFTWYQTEKTVFVGTYNYDTEK